MKRAWSALLGAGLATLLLGACGQSQDASVSPYGGSPVRDCRQYTSCGTCTPVSGCGWCYLGAKAGMCAADPNECASSAVFTWTWDPSGCYVPADASIVPSDASEAGSVDALPGARDAPSSEGSAALDGAPEATADAPSDSPSTDAREDAAAAADGGSDAADSGALPFSQSAQ